MSDDTVTAPFTPEQVRALELFQRGNSFPPYYCSDQSNEAFRAHREAATRTGKSSPVVTLLTPTASGLVCEGCGAVRQSVPSGVLAYAIHSLYNPAAPVAAKRKGKR